MRRERLSRAPSRPVKNITLQPTVSKLSPGKIRLITMNATLAIAPPIPAPPPPIIPLIRPRHRGGTLPVPSVCVGAATAPAAAGRRA